MLRNIEAVQGLSKMTRSALGPQGKFTALNEAALATSPFVSLLELLGKVAQQKLQLLPLFWI